MNKKPTYEELELGIKKWRRAYFIMIIIISALLFISIYVSSKNDNLEKELRYHEYNDALEVPEVINGNLYIGYEDGVRVGYHKDYLNKSIWYRCAKKCEVITD